MNNYTLIFQKCLIVGFYVFQYFKFNQAKRYDETLKLTLNKRSLIEVVVVALINIAFIVYPVSESVEGILLFVGIVMMLYTFFHTYRYVGIGKKLIFAQQHAFDIRQITKKSYEKGKFVFVIRDTPVSVRYPIADINLVMERLSGRKPRKNKK
ncbi:hypothetical protein AOC36_03755 [Erysipelothrix larvae]|uniref:Uncharacterized protein n=1 Tax=Erysipelothrix larvae TaxID=1514105 RepID=A0A109UGR9_9FIRM|nr:hypothetical protein [Erysipelothrix larvae]AMC93118.1 hypothetical protein AOC36_03755 [Erysipelothrix larvae]